MTTRSKKKRGQPKTKKESGPKAEIGKLQGMLLTALFSGQPLPGANTPMNFPDLPTVVSQPNVILADENLDQKVQVKGSPKPVKILSLAEIRAQARAGQDLIYLHFQPANVGDDSVGLTLAAKIMPANPDQRTLGLSTVQIKFRKVGAEWLAESAPMYSAS